MLIGYSKKQTLRALAELCEIFNLTNIVKGKTCFNKADGSSLDVFLTNHPRCFQSTCVIEAGVSDHHGVMLTCLKSTFQKLPPKK